MPGSIVASTPPTQPMAADVKPVLDEATRTFVRRALAAGLVEIDDLKKVVVSLLADDDQFSPKQLANGMIGAGILTKWQATKLLLGRSKGFYLGSYRLLRPIGKGGMGVLYLGEQLEMKQLMALRILPREATDNPRRLAQLKKEARACVHLDHPNIVHAYDFAEAGGRFYIVMEFVDGIDLHHAVDRDGVMSTAEVIDLLTQAASGLEHAHQRGIVHCDIKPANLLLRTDGKLKISGLGLARVGLGKLSSQNVDASVDIYSLGCTAFFLLTGRAPFEADSIKQRLARHQTVEVPDVRAMRQDCPESLAVLIRRMMAKRPCDRPKSTSELLGQLKRLGGGNHAKPDHVANPIKPSSDTDLNDGDLLRLGKIGFRLRVDQVDHSPTIESANQTSGSIIKGDALDTFDVAGFLNLADEADRVERYEKIRKKHQQASDSDVFDDPSLDESRSSISFITDGYDNANADSSPTLVPGRMATNTKAAADKSTSSPPEPAQSRFKPKASLVKSGMTGLASVFSPADHDADRRKLIFTTILTVAILGLAAFKAYDFAAGPPVRVLNEID